MKHDLISRKCGNQFLSFFVRYKHCLNTDSSISLDDSYNGTNDYCVYLQENLGRSVCTVGKTSETNGTWRNTCESTLEKNLFNVKYVLGILLRKVP